MHSQRDSDPRLIAFARQMRREPSDAERRMWWLLRRNRMGGLRFRRQMPLLGYIADFCCIAAKCVIEVDRAQHGEPSQMRWDAARTAVFEEAGYPVLRLTAWDVLKFSDAVTATIYKRLFAAKNGDFDVECAENPRSQTEADQRSASAVRRRPPPQPSPGVPGEGVKTPTRKATPTVNA